MSFAQDNPAGLHIVPRSPITDRVSAGSDSGSSVLFPEHPCERCKSPHLCPIAYECVDVELIVPPVFCATLWLWGWVLDRALGLVNRVLNYLSRTENKLPTIAEREDYRLAWLVVSNAWKGENDAYGKAYIRVYGGTQTAVEAHLQAYRTWMLAKPVVVMPKSAQKVLAGEVVPVREKRA
jgi:hypothetical protein